MTILLHLNLAVRLLLELVALAAVAVAAWRVTGPGPLAWVAATAAPLAAAGAWAAVVHGEQVPGAVQVLGQLAALATAVACLLVLGAPRTAAAAVTGAALLNAALLAVWQQ